MRHSSNLEAKKRQLFSAESQRLMKEEIGLLQKELDCQTVVRSALEKAIDCQPLLADPTCKSLSKPAEDLIKEIALLELEVVYLEKYLLSMYRRNFAKRLPLSLPKVEERPKTDAETPTLRSLQLPKTSLESVSKDSDKASPLKTNDVLIGLDPLSDTGIYRCHSSLSHSACSFRASPPYRAAGEALDSYHSMPLSMLEHAQEDAHNREKLVESPNWLSEEMIKCISTIYSQLSDPPLSAQGASREDSGMLYSMVQVCSIARDPQRLNGVEDLLQKYRSIIYKLGNADPSKLNHEEKLAFWINVHNALAMHAFLVYGVPRGSLKRVSLVLKAAYDVGGHTVSVDTIQNSILGCRLPRPTQWLHSLFFPRTKFKARDPRKLYAVKDQEPRLHFALCSGCRSDPAVRLYTAKKVHQELEMAKEEYIAMNIKVQKEQRLVVPKNVECFIKETRLTQLETAQMLEHSMPQAFQKQGKLWKKLDYGPHNFAFRFMLSHELMIEEKRPK